MLGTQCGHEGAAHCRESLQSTPAHRQTSQLLLVLGTYFRSSDARRSRGVGKESANSSSSAPPEEKLQRGSRDGVAVGAGVSRTAPAWARRGAVCPARGCGSGRQRRQPTTHDSGEGGQPRGGSEAGPGRPRKPQYLPILLRGASPHPRPQLRGCHFCAPPGKGTGPGALRGVVEEDARVLVMSPSCSPELARKAVEITPPKLSFAAV